MLEYDTWEDEDTGYRCKVYYDETPPNPREDWDNLCKIVVPDRCRYLSSEYDLGLEWDDRDADLEILESPEVYDYRPIYVYDHSAVSFSLGSFCDPWDSGQIGYIVALREDVENEWGKEKADTDEVKKLVVQNMEGEVEALDQYSRGEVYWYEIVDENDDQVDSCGGYFGDAGLEDIKAAFEWHVEDRKQEIREQKEEDNSLLVSAGIDPETVYEKEA